MRWFVTGNRGFIGSYLQKATDAMIVDGDLCDPLTLPDCDVVAHLAAFNGTRWFYEMPYEVAKNGVHPTINLLDRYRFTDISKFIYASTCEIHNDATGWNIAPVPTPESAAVLFNNPHNPRWSYAQAKLVCENMVVNSGLPYAVIRYFNVYGPGARDHFIEEFVERALEGDVTLKGNDTRAFCYVDDAVSLTRQIAECPDGTYNVGNPRESSIKEVATIILDEMGINPNTLKIEEAPVGSATRRAPDMTHTLSHCTVNYTPLEEGIRCTVRHILES